MSTQTDTINASEAERVVFDHAGGQLLSSAEAAEFTKVPVENDDDAGAAAWLIKNNSWNLAYVHVHESVWKELVAKVSQGRILVRFSSEGFHPMPLESANPLCLRCLRKTEELRDTEEANDVGRLSEAVLKPDAFEQLGKGTAVPPELAGLISFSEPHRLRSLETLLAAILAAWASDGKDAESRKKAKDALGLEMQPPAPPEGFTKRRSLWRHLGWEESPEGLAHGVDNLKEDLAWELGVEKLANDPGLEVPLREFADLVFAGSADEEIGVDDVVNCFTAVHNYLKKL